MKRIACLAILAAASVPVALAADVTWINPGTSSWFTPENWDPALPTTADDASLVTGTAQVDAAGAVVSELSLGPMDTDADLTSVGHVSLDSGGVLEVADVTAYRGTLDFNGGTLRAGMGGVTILEGFGEGEGGTVTLGAGGGTIDTAGRDVDTDAAFTGTGQLIKVGTGTLELTGSSTLTGHIPNVGIVTIKEGTLALHGGNTSMSQTNGDLYVGETSGDNGTLKLEQKATYANVNAYLGIDPGSSGTATVTGLSTHWQNSNLLALGFDGTGTLTVSDGGRVSDSSGHIGYFSGTGSATVTGGGIWENSSDLKVGEEGHGTLTIQDEGLVSVGNGNGIVVVASANGSSGTLNIGPYDLSDGGLVAGTLEAHEVTFGSGTGVINFNQSDDITFGANITGGAGSIVQRNTAATTLSGTNTYTGATVVEAGTLRLTGTLSGTSGISVASGATFENATGSLLTLGASQALSGSGTVAGPVALDGPLAPGSGGVGRLTFTGNLTLNGTTTIEIGSLASFDSISVGGDLAYGGTLELAFLDGFVPSAGDSFALFSVAGTPAGGFANIDFSSPGLVANFNDVTGVLSFAAIPEPSTYALCITGLLAMTLLARRRRTHAQK